MHDKPLNYLYIWDRTLNPDEKVLYETNISIRYIFVYLFITFVLFSFLIFPIPVILFYYLFYIRVANAYCFTNKRVLIHKGWLSRKLISIEYPRITDVHVIEPFIDRFITGSGNIIINTAGTRNYESIIENVDNPNEVKKV
jgi:uncharacterized membrane protein YdbT with pleckstrin-like domain